jgi:hypothetical protein
MVLVLATTATTAVVIAPSLSHRLFAASRKPRRNGIASDFRRAKVPIAQEHSLLAAGVRPGDRGSEG